MKVFLTGASGILGSDIQLHLESKGIEVLGFDSTNINITSFSDIQKKAVDFHPDVIIHSAAMTNVDLCEEDQEMAMKVNVVGTHNLAVAALRTGARMVYISSCGVYGNEKKSPYCETDATNPVNYHHYTKLLGEQKVREHLNDFVIIRPGWLFGGTTSHRKNFVEARRREAQAAQVLKSAVDKWGSPTYTGDVAEQIFTMIQKEVCGTFNVVNEGQATRYDYVSEIVRLFNFPTRVEPVGSGDFIRKAQMPDNESLLNRHLSLQQINGMKPWKEALQSYIQKTYQI